MQAESNSHKTIDWQTKQQNSQQAAEANPKVASHELLLGVNLLRLLFQLIARCFGVFSRLNAPWKAFTRLQHTKNRLPISSAPLCETTSA
jgi:hypothetical protein